MTYFAENWFIGQNEWTGENNDSVTGKPRPIFESVTVVWIDVAFLWIKNVFIAKVLSNLQSVSEKLVTAVTDVW